jgi:hypothetical protein
MATSSPIVLEFDIEAVDLADWREPPWADAGMVIVDRHVRLNRRRE